MTSATEGLNTGQTKAIKTLLTGENVFLTGGAGVGKTFLARRFIEIMERFGVHVPVVASTGAAAVLAGGQTFHRFFGMDGAKDVDALVARALSRNHIWERLTGAQCILLDEVSMLPGYVLEAAYKVAQTVRRNKAPWGGIKVLAVGDFRQLPPVVKAYEGAKPWAFLTRAWEESAFVPVMLTEPVRSTDKDFVDILGDARIGKLTDRIQAFLEERTVGEIEADIPRVYARKMDVESFNMAKLDKLPGRMLHQATSYSGSDRHTDDLRKHAPVPEHLYFKVGALVMMRQNDRDDRYVNGSIGHILDFLGSGQDLPTIIVKLFNGHVIQVRPGKFFTADEYGKVLATAENYPMTLAWATTIHKSQGATMDTALLDLAGLWEPGQLYVALSRVRTPEGVKVISWDPRAFKKDRKVSEFHKKLLEQIQGEVDV